MEKQQEVSSRQRLQELLGIPERQRTEAQWDEINELEFALTPVNRAASSDRHRRKEAVTAEKPKPREGMPGKRPLRRLRKRPKPTA